MAVIKAGSFVKTATPGTTTQDVPHGLGVVPKALILFHAGGTASATYVDFATPFLSFTDENRSSICIATGHTDNDSGGDSARRYGAYAMAQINGSNASFGFNATVSAWDTTNFTLSYPADSTSTAARIIGFLAIGGSTVQSKVVDHTLDGDTGPDPITGAGFTPTLALMLSGGNLTGGLPVTDSSHGILSFGVTDGTNQFTLGTGASNAVSQPDAHRSQRTDNCFLSLNTTQAYTWLAAVTSLDSDGMTLNVTTAGTAASHLGVLFLRGVAFKMGFFDKDDSGSTNAVDTISTPDVNPQGVMLASFQNVATTSIVDHGRFVVGFSDGTNEYTANYNDQDFDSNSNSNVSSYLHTTKAFHEQNNDSKSTTGLADLAVATEQFALTWTTNFTVATEICYVAFGDIAISADVTGTAGDGTTEVLIVAGGQTIIITLTNDTWVASGATFNAQRQNIIDGIDSAQAEAAGWDAVVKAGLAVTDVVRTSDTVVTITLPAFGSYNITASETITVTVPGTAVTSASPIVATPTFLVAAGRAIPPFPNRVLRVWPARR
jgi:hypothetical protein